MLRPAQLGGAQAFISDLAAGLTSRGHDVTLYCAEGSDIPGVKLSMVTLPADAHASLVMPGGRPARSTPGVIRAFEAMFDSIAAGSFDAVSQHAFDAPAFDLARGLPVIHTLHMPPIVPAVVTAARDIAPDALATVSDACQATWKRAGVDVRRVLFNGVPSRALPRAGTEAVALVAGRISPEKGIEDAIAAAHAAGLEVQVAGGLYDPDYEVDLRAVRYLGSMPRDELSRLMATSAVTICAVRWDEPYGMVAAEAQMSGCPVAAYRRGALPEVVEDGVSGFLADPDDVDALGRAIERCLHLDRGAVRASAERRLGLDAALDRYESALRDVAR